MHTIDDLVPEQNNAIDFLKGNLNALLCADVGTGKTVMSLTAVDHHIRIRGVGPWLVLAPLLVADETWRYEAEEWAHLNHLSVGIVTGDTKDRVKTLNTDHDIYVVNYENLSWLMDYVKDPYTFEKLPSGEPVCAKPIKFKGLIADEIDKLKEVSSNRFKNFRNYVKNFDVRIGLTGTLIPNDLLEIWGQTYIVDGGKRFGRSYYKFRQEYFYPLDYRQHRWRVLPLKDKIIEEKIYSLALRVKSTDLPKTVELPPARLVMPDNAWKIYNELENELFIKLEDQNCDIEADNMAILSGKLQQICAGFSYVDPKECPECGHTELIQALTPSLKKVIAKWDCVACHKRINRRVVWHTQKRFDWLDSLFDQIVIDSGQQLMIFYNFNEEGAELRRRYEGIELLGGGTSKAAKRQAIHDWNSGELRAIGLHPASAAHGLNMQKSGAHNIAFLTEPWSGGLKTQAIGRLGRRGQVAKEIYVHTAQFINTVDVRVHDIVTERIDTREIFLDKLRKAK